MDLAFAYLYGLWHMLRGAAPMQLISRNEATAPERTVTVTLNSETTLEPLAGLTPTAEILKAGAADFTAIAGTISEIGAAGDYRVDLAAADVDTLGPAVLRLTATGANPTRRYLQIVTLLDDAQALGKIGTPHVVAASPFSQDGELRLVAGDDHSGQAALQRSFTHYTGQDPGACTAHLYIMTAAGYAAGTGTPVLSKALAAPTVTIEADGSKTVTVTIELTPPDLASLAEAPPADPMGYVYQITLETAGGLTTTLEIGTLTLIANVSS